jgi:hypothetical protein
VLLKQTKALDKIEIIEAPTKKTKCKNKNQPQIQSGNDVLT